MTHEEMMQALLDGRTVHRPGPHYTAKLKLVDGQIRDIVNDCTDGLPANPAQWTIKPSTININGIEVPEPVREALEKDTLYHMPSVIDGVVTRSWTGCANDYEYLYRGIVHLTKQGASTHITALLSFTKL